jgi:cytochrome c553
VNSLPICLLALALIAGAPSASAQNIAKRMQACTTCHGAGSTATVGRTANELYFPRIAGKPAGYLYNQLVNFRDGRRHYGLMVGLVEHLNDAALMEMAQYFSQLQLPYPEPQAPPAGTSATVMQRGAQLALRGDSGKGIAACASCHGAQLLGAEPAIPGLLGLPRDYMAKWVLGKPACGALMCLIAWHRSRRSYRRKMSMRWPHGWLHSRCHRQPSPCHPLPHCLPRCPSPAGV